MRQFCLAVVVFLLSTLFAKAQNSGQSDELTERAAQLFEEKQFAEAYPLYSQLVSLRPKDADLNFRFGTCTIFSGESREDAIKHLLFAEKRGATDIRLRYYLGKAYHLNYQFAKAKTQYQMYLDGISPKEKNPLPAKRNIAMCDQGKQLLSSIKDIVVIDKKSADVEAFFRFYNLEEIGGKILTIPEELQSKYDKKVGYEGVLYRNTNNATIYFSSYGKSGDTGLDIYETLLLPDGTFSSPKKLSERINTPFDEEFAYMHPDGKTFYFASKGHNSMGGYDVFKSVNEGGLFTDPINLDFAINTPDDDLFFVTDSAHRTAYFASSRASKQGELDVYKVMVDGIPIQMMFIKGTFVNDVVSNERLSKLKIIDELSNRTIYETKTDVLDGDYVLSFPKAGLYRLELQVEGSQVIHEGTFELPTLDHSAALGQELKLVNKQGLEQLVIQNYFDEELNVDLAELASENLRQRATLDVNATDERIAEAEKQAESSSESAAAVHLRAGFNTEETPEIIAAEMSQEADRYAQEAQLSAAKSNASFQRAEELYDESREQMAAAQAIMKKAEGLEGNAYFEALKEYNELVVSARDAQRESYNALETAESFAAINKNQQEQAQNLSIASSAIQADLNGEKEATLNYLVTERERRRGGSDAFAMAYDAKRDAVLAIENEVTNFENRLISLQEDEARLKSSIKANENQLSSTNKKKEIEELQGEIAREQGELEYVKEQIAKASDVISEKSEQGVNLQTQLRMMDGLNAQDVEGQNASLNQAELMALKSSLQIARDKSASLMLDDETIASISEETKATRNDITKLTAIEATALKQGLPIQSIASLRENYALKKREIQSSGVDVEGRMSALNDETFEAIQEQQQLISESNLDYTADEQIEYEAALNDIMSDLPQTIAQTDIAEANTTNDTSQIDASESTTEEPTDQDEAIAFEEELGALSDTNSEPRERLEAYAKSQELIQDLEERGAAVSPENQAIIDDYETQLMADFDLQYQEEKSEIAQSGMSREEQIEAEIALSERTIQSLEDLEQLAKGNPGVSDRLQVERQRLDTRENDLESFIMAEGEDGVLIERLPEDETSLISAILPEYESTFSEIQNETDESERLNRSLSLNENIASGAQVAIDERVQAMDSTDDERLKERYQLEITRLQSVLNKRANERMSLLEQKDDLLAEVVNDSTDGAEEGQMAEATDPAGLNASSSDAIDSETESSSEEVSSFEADASITTKIRSYNEVQSQLTISEDMAASAAFEHEQFKRSSALLDEDKVGKDLDKIIDAAIEIQALEAEMDAAESSSKKKKIDKKIERAYFDRSSSEIRISKALENTNLQLKETNALAIEVLTDEGVTNELIEKEIQKVQRDTDEAFEEAAALRKSAEPEIDEIKQADMYKRAALIEMQALESQENLIVLLNEQEKVADLNGSELQAMLNGIPSEEVITRSAVVNDISDASDAESITENPASDTVENDSASSTGGVGSTETSDGQLDLVETDVDTSDSASIVELARSELASNFPIVSTENFQPENPSLEEELGLSEEDYALLVATPEMEEVLEIEEEVRAEESAKQSLIERRQALVETINAERTKLLNVTLAAENSQNQAEKEGLQIQANDIEQRLEKDYASLASLDAAIAEKEEVLTDAVERRSALIIELDAAEIVAEARNSTTASTVETVPTSAIAPELALAKSENYFFTASSSAAKYAFEMPEVLTEELFAIGDESMYSASAPIPMDLEMPSGVVYKVQLGAFRNPIAQDLFGNFTPLAGESAGGGLTRYTVGLFKTYTTADLAKGEVREMGFRDAFVVAYRDGVRIPLYEARGETDDDIDTAAIAKAKELSQPEAEIATTSTGDDSETTQAAALESVIDSREVESGVEEIAIADVQNWKAQKGAFYTVQVGVFSKRVSTQEIGVEGDVMIEKLNNGYYRYSLGKFAGIEQAQSQKSSAVTAGVSDAFVTAYLDGERVGVNGLGTVPTLIPEPEVVSVQKQFRMIIGTYQDEVPSQSAILMLQYESEFGIKQVQTASGTMYVTKPSSEAEANRMKQVFESQGAEVQGIEEVQ